MTDNNSKPQRLFTLYEGDLKATVWAVKSKNETQYYANFYGLSETKPRRWKRNPRLHLDKRAEVQKLVSTVHEMALALTTS